MSPPDAGLGAAPSLLMASFRDSYRELQRYLSLRTGNPDEARELAHDTWLRVADLTRAGREPAWRDDGEARAYLFTVARNLVIDQRRRDGLARRHAEPALSAREQLPEQAPDTADAAMYGQAVQAVEGALASLPERTRTIFLRHRVDGVDQRLLAAEFGLSRNMVEREVMLAMDRVQAAMERWHAGVAGGAADTPRRGRRRSLAALLGVAGLGLGTSGVWRWWQFSVPQWQLAARTPVGRSLRQPLPDGSVVTLDALTRLQLAYYGRRRHATLLQGAAFFDVVPDAQRPFVVDVPAAPAPVADASGADTDRHAATATAAVIDTATATATARHGSLRITVLGTRFGVERRVDGGVEVQVECGRVRVETLDARGQARRAVELGPGDALRHGATDGADEPSQVTRLAAAQSAAGWRHGAIGFDDTALAEAIERLRRYLPRPVELDPAVATLRLSGLVKIARAEDFLRALPGILPVRSNLEDQRWRIGPR